MQVQLQFYFRRENNSQFEANPFHTLEHIHNGLCSCIHHFIPVQQTMTYFAKNKTKVLVHPFYSFSLNLVSQASTSSQDIHAFNFTDPPFSFETTYYVVSLKILINTNSPKFNLLNNQNSRSCINLEAEMHIIMPI